MSLFETNGDPVTFDALVGEGKKYKDADAAAKAIIEKDRFIETLKAEKQEIMSRIPTTPVVDRSQEILDRLENLAQKAATEMPVTTPQERVDVRNLTEADIARILDQRERTAREAANVNTVKRELSEKFGDKFPQVLTTLQSTLGVDQKYLDNLAATSPAAFNALINGLQPSQPSAFTPPVSTQGQPFKPQGGGVQPRSAYLKLKADNPTVYNSKATQDKMYKDSMELGEAFFDTNE